MNDQIRNAAANDDGSFDCEISTPQFGWVPFTARGTDTEQLGRLVHQLIVDEGLADGG